MKIVNRTALLSLALLAGCASSQVKHDHAAHEGNRIKIAIGSRDNVHVNDKVYLLEKKCIETPKVPLCSFSPVGTLTVKEIAEQYSVVEPDKDLIFKEGFYFKFAFHCEGKSDNCTDSP